MCKFKTNIILDNGTNLVLETGMLVELRNGQVGMIYNDTIVFKDTCYLLNKFDFDLDSIISSNFDIMKVKSAPKDGIFLIPDLYWNKSGMSKDNLWVRLKFKKVGQLELQKNHIKNVVFKIKELQLTLSQKEVKELINFLSDENNK